MIRAKQIAAAASVAAVASLVGCTAFEAAERQIEAGTRQTQHLADAASAKARGPVISAQAPFLGRSVIEAGPSTTLPAHLECEACFVAISGVPLDLAATVDWLARQTGLAVALGGPQPAADAQVPTWRPRFRGRLSAFLDAVAARFDIAWSLQHSTIRMDRVVTRLYRLAAGATASTLSATTSGSVSGDTGDTGQTIEARARVDTWSEIDNLVTTLLPAGTRYALSPASGTLTFTARPSIHAHADRLVQQINAILSPRVTVRVSLYLVDVSDGDDYGLNIDALVRDAGAGLDVGLEGLASEVVGAAGALSGAIVTPQASDASVSTGAALVARAVSRSGRLVDRHHAVVSSRSATATPVQMTTRTNYVKELKVTREDGETSLSTVVETLVTGYSLQVLPRVVDGGRLSLYLAIATADLIDLNTQSFGDDGAFLSLPTVAQRVFTLDNAMADGETLVLAGYDQDRSALHRRGTGTPGFWGLGGAGRAAVTRTRLIIVVEPRIRSRPRPRSPAPLLITKDRAGPRS